MIRAQTGENDCKRVETIGNWMIQQRKTIKIAKNTLLFSLESQGGSGQGFYKITWSYIRGSPVHIKTVWHLFWLLHSLRIKRVLITITLLTKVNKNLKQHKPIYFCFPNKTFCQPKIVNIFIQYNFIFIFILFAGWKYWMLLNESLICRTTI